MCGSFHISLIGPYQSDGPYCLPLANTGQCVPNNSPFYIGACASCSKSYCKTRMESGIYAFKPLCYQLGYVYDSPIEI